MQDAADLINLPFTSDLAQAGRTYALRALCRGQVALSQWPFQDLRTLAARAAAELAFRRRLYTEKVPHSSQCLSPLADSDRTHPVIGQRRCELVNQCLSRPETVHRLQSDRSRLLAFGARLPFTQAPSYMLTEEDLFIFSFVLAPELPPGPANQTGFFVYPLPKHWARPEPGNGLGRLTLACSADREIGLELGGLGPDRQVLCVSLRLQPGEQCQPAAGFTGLAYLQRAEPYQGTLSLTSTGLQQTIRIGGSSWGSIRLAGPEIILAGYITRGDYFQKAQLTPTQPEKDHAPLTYTLPIQQLHPLNDLFVRARAWAEAEF